MLTVSNYLFAEKYLFLYLCLNQLRNFCFWLKTYNFLTYEPWVLEIIGSFNLLIVISELWPLNFDKMQVSTHFSECLVVLSYFQCMSLPLKLQATFTFHFVGFFIFNFKILQNFGLCTRCSVSALWLIYLKLVQYMPSCCCYLTKLLP